MSLLERIHFFHQELTRNRYPNARTLMREFEISQATARRDIAYLRDRLLAPLAYDQQKNGFYYEDHSFSLPFLNNSRIALLLGMLNRFAEETGLKQLPEIKQLEQRLSALLDGDYQRLNDILHCEWIEVEHPDPQVFDTTLEAIVRQHQLFFIYQSPGQQASERTVEPLKLINYQGRWYLLAWCTLRQAPRTFHLARISSPTIGAKITSPSQTTDQHLESSFGIFKGKPRYHAEILFTGTAAQLVKSQIWHKDQTVQETKEGVIFRLPVRDDREIIMKVLQYGSQVRVLRPLSLIDAIKGEVGRMTRLATQNSGH